MRNACLLLVVLVALAGCSDGDPPPQGAGDAGPQGAPVDDGVLPWDLGSCALVMGLIDVPRDAVQAQAPAGFEVLVTNGAGPVELTTVGIEAFRCATAAGLAGNLTDAPFGGLWALVEPDPAVEVPDVGVHFLRLDFLVVEASMRAALQGAGAPARDGGAVATTGDLGLVEGVLTMEGLGTFRLRGVETDDRVVNQGYAFAEYAPADGGVVVWRLTWEDHGTTSLRGTVELPAGSWLAEAAGATVVPANIEAGQWSFQGNVTLP